MSYIFKYLKENYPTIEEVSIFSDGAAFDFVLKWNFFATSHGKGAVDGIGGTIKGSVWREVRNGHVNINTPEQYSTVAQQRNPNIHVHYIAKAEIEALGKKLSITLK